MSLPELSYIVQWWFMLFLAGFAFLPLTAILFSSFRDKGYAFAKIIGVIIVSYAVYVLGTVRIVPFTSWTIYAMFLLLGVGSLVLISRTKLFKQINLKQLWKLFVFEEMLFIAALWFWAFIRSFNPEIYGLEKYMDFGFINSILRTPYFPPNDMWFTPYPINYYYFGHLVTAVLTKASSIPSFISYNLMLASIFAFTFIQSFSIGITLWNKFAEHREQTQQDKTISSSHTLRTTILVGILTAVLVVFSGNLHILYAFFKPYENENPVPLWNLQFSFINKDYIPNDPLSSPFAFPNSYWYPNATRFIHNTIHEFPMYSWVVADLHGHVLDIPHVLLTIGFLLAMFFTVRKKKSHTFELFSLLTIGFFLAVMYMTNAWDSLTYLLLAGIVLCYLYWEQIQAERSHTRDDRKTIQSSSLLFYLLPDTKRVRTFKHFILKHPRLDWFSRVTLAVFFIASSYLVFSLPFSYYFNPSQIVSGIGVLCAPKFLTDIGHLGPILFEKDHCQKSPWWQLLILYGFFYFFVTVFFIYINRAKKWSRSDGFVMLLILTGTILIVIPEFLYMKDIYPAHYRANTMFKLVFQAFMLLSISCAYIIIRTVSAAKQFASTWDKKLLFAGYFVVVVSMLTLVLTYPILATRSYYGNLLVRHGLNGVKYLQERFPSDYEGIRWLQTHVAGQPVIAEAQGDSYSDYARVSANTGLPTILGWTVHEWLWRGSYDVPAPRISEIQTLYDTQDMETAKQLLAKYKVEYVFVGELERQKYPSLSEKKFEKLGKKVFKLGKTAIYHIND